MAEQLTINWIRSGEQTPPVKERLLLVFSAAGDPPNGTLIGKSEIVIGYWTGNKFRSMTRPEPGNIIEVKATHWATLDRLPQGIRLQPRSEFGESIRE